jgi:hypothetical protein
MELGSGYRVDSPGDEQGWTFKVGAWEAFVVPGWRISRMVPSEPYLVRSVWRIGPLVLIRWAV